MSNSAPSPSHGNEADTNQLSRSGYIMLGLAGVFWFAMLENIISDHRTRFDGYPFHFAGLFSLFFALALWFVLLVLLTTTATRRSSRWTKLAAPGVFLASLVGTLGASDLYVAGQWWGVFIVVILAPFVAFFAIRPTLTVAVTIILLSTPPVALDWVRVARAHANELAAQERGRQQSLARAKEHEAAEQLKDAAFSKLGPDSTMSEYLAFMDDPRRMRAALDGIRMLKSRQSDAVLLLRKGRLADLSGLYDYDIEPTVELCSTYATEVSSYAPIVYSPLGRVDWHAVTVVEKQLPNQKWLVESGCNLSASLAEVVSKVHAAAQSQKSGSREETRLTKLASDLATLRGTK